MRSRGLVVAIAVVLAIVASAAVILYTNGVKEDAVTGGSLSEVVVASQDIPANTNLNPLLDQGVFSTLRVPTDAVVDGAISDLSQLRGLTSTAPILANEQIPVGRLSSGEAPQGGSLPPGDHRNAARRVTSSTDNEAHRHHPAREGRPGQLPRTFVRPAIAALTRIKARPRASLHQINIRGHACIGGRCSALQATSDLPFGPCRCSRSPLR